MNLTDTLFVAGHRGMVGSAIVRRLQALGCANILTAGRDALDLTDQRAVDAFYVRDAFGLTGHRLQEWKEDNPKQSKYDPAVVIDYCKTMPGTSDYAFNIRTLAWSPEMCALFGVPMAALPEVLPSSGRFGVTSARWPASTSAPSACSARRACTTSRRWRRSPSSAAASAIG